MIRQTTVAWLVLIAACGARSELDGRANDAGAIPDASISDEGAADVSVDADAGIAFDVTPPQACLAQIAAGEMDTCAIKLDGSLWCWGRHEASAVPVEMTTLGHDVAHVSAGYDHVCASTQSGTVWCWGRNNFGQLGTGNNDDTTVPTTVVGLDGVVQISAGDHETCAIKNDGHVWCWGYDAEGQLGDGLFSANANAPVQVVGFDDAAQVAVGGDQVCARKTDGTLWCWGFNGEGQLGDEDAGWQTNSAIPIQVTSLGTSVVDVTAGSSFTCARKSDGTIWCWGYGTPCLAQLGQAMPTPTVFGADNAESASKGSQTCVQKLDGTAECCGEYHQGIPPDAGSMLAVVPLGPVAEIAVGNFTACARTSNAMWCWGLNVYGQIGDGTQSGTFCYNDDPYQGASPPWVCRRTPTSVVGICP